MAQRTVQQFIADITREVRGQCTALEAQQALRDALDVIDSKANWEFLIAKKLVNINPAYSTGNVIVVSPGGTGAAGSGTGWTALQSAPYTPSYMSIKFSSRRMPYEILSISNDTLLFFTTPFSGTTGISAAESYTIFQTRYALPSDCEPGRDLKLTGPLGMGDDGCGTIRKVPNLTFERKRQDFVVAAGGPYWYTDGPYDETNKVATIQLWPYPKVAGELRLTYYRKLTIPTTLASNIMIPEAFERLPIMLAASQIMQTKNQQGWLEKKTMAEKMMADLYARHAVSPAYDTDIEPTIGGSYGGTSGIDGIMYTQGDY